MGKLSFRDAPSSFLVEEMQFCGAQPQAEIIHSLKLTPQGNLALTSATWLVAAIQKCITKGSFFFFTVKYFHRDSIHVNAHSQLGDHSFFSLLVILTHVKSSWFSITFEQVMALESEANIRIPEIR